MPTTGGTQVKSTTTVTATANVQRLYAHWEVAGEEFQKTTDETFIKGAKYIICYDTYALKNNSGSIDDTTVSITNDKIITNDTSIMWTYDGSYFINDANGTKYYLTSSSSSASLSTSSGGGISYSSSTSKLIIGSYYLRYNSGFTGSSSSYASAITIYRQTNEVAVLATKADAIGANSIQVTATARLLSGSCTFEYKLYIGDSLKATKTGTSGSNVYLTATGLSANTTYNFYVVATATTDSSLTNTSNTISGKTYLCSGTGTYTCSPPTELCSTCQTISFNGVQLSSGINYSSRIWL